MFWQQVLNEESKGTDGYLRGFVVPSPHLSSHGLEEAWLAKTHRGPLWNHSIFPMIGPPPTQPEPRYANHLAVSRSFPTSLPPPQRRLSAFGDFHQDHVDSNRKPLASIAQSIPDNFALRSGRSTIGKCSTFSMHGSPFTQQRRNKNGEKRSIDFAETILYLTSLY